ncbi:hypothetical protein MVEN_02491800 [Mycena venus]|uniref:Uncharacterized protein n=1 Tax=Mycena venus TaxID=2733690 RepID=A0A8H7CBW4_9AGAR|nr:hypothetical protein MVEN_02491800 [Mycena venus]
MPPTRTDSQLSESYIQDAFHSYLKSSLTQAKAERLLDADVLSSAEGDLMITGPALCLYFAALRCTTNPPSVPLPRHNKNSQPMELSYDNCPQAFVSFLRVWSSTVPAIQALAPEYQHDLARMICNLEPLITPLQPSLNGIAADLRAVAIEISQRRSFQDRYASDLQAALDSGTTPTAPSPKRAAFVPPPMGTHGARRNTPTSIFPRSHLLSSPPPGSSASSGFPPRSPSPQPTILAHNSPAIEFIRETLYASLADALDQQPALRSLLKTDPPRAYFASVAFAVLEVATSSMTPDGAVIGVLGEKLTLEKCPPELRPFMAELAAIGRAARELQEEDDTIAMKHAARGQEIPPTRMDRVRLMLEQGVGYAQGRRDNEEGRRSVEGRAVSFTNRINALSLGMTRLKAFRERQDDVFKVLAGIGA